MKEKENETRAEKEEREGIPKIMMKDNEKLKIKRRGKKIRTER